MTRIDVRVQVGDSLLAASDDPLFLGLRGEGQVLMSSDTGVDVTHDQFRDPELPIPGYGDYPTHRKLIEAGMKRLRQGLASNARNKLAGAAK